MRPGGSATRPLDTGLEKRKAKHRTGHEDERMLDHYDHPEVDEIYEDDFEFMKTGEDSKIL
ncbi:hypothetical protein KAR91_32650 [Candidatus Pacearchaeota archaeon]|nr:hypothetical protein [Candidatus Pacearchaeota archaeon]